MKLAATTTWNSVELIDKFLTHYRKLGLDQIMIMDFGSTDGTTDIILDQKWTNFARLIPFPGLGGIDSSNIFLEIIKNEYSPITQCLFCDPDEFLVTPNMDSDDIFYDNSIITSPGISIPRYNMLTHKDDVVYKNLNMHAFGSLIYRIDESVSRKSLDEIEKLEMNPPWIYTSMPGKILINAECVQSIKLGDHSVESESGKVQPAPEGNYLLHFPLRTWPEFEAKVQMARIDIEKNPQRPELAGWHVRRWSKISQQGDKLLFNEYISQFPSRDEMSAAMERGAITLDRSIVEFNN